MEIDCQIHKNEFKKNLFRGFAVEDMYNKMWRNIMTMSFMMKYLLANCQRTGLVQELQNGTLWKGRMDLLFIFIGSVF